MKKLLALTLIAATCNAWACDKCNTKPSNTYSTSSSIAVSGDSDSRASSNASGGDSSVNVQAREIPVSSAYAPSVWATSECMGSSSGGASGMNIGLSFGTTWKDKDCSLFKAAKEFETAGYAKDAMIIRCKSELVSDTPICKELKQ